MSLRLRILNAMLRSSVKRWAAQAGDPVDARRDMERSAGWTLKRAPGTVTHWRDLGGRPALWIRAGARQHDAAVLYFHGGAHVSGSPLTHLSMLSHLARYSGVEVIALDQRLAPEHPYPAALDDAHAAWNDLLARGHAPERIVIAGDSAGGGLALGLLARLCATGTVPAGLVGFAPWTDLTGASPSMRENAQRDSMLVAERLPEVAKLYLQGTPADEPGASPLFADFPGCPPVLLQCSDAEVLRDDSYRMAERLRAFGADVQLQTWDETPHVWQLFIGYVPEARDALRDAGAAIQTMLRSSARSRGDS